MSWNPMEKYGKVILKRILKTFVNIKNASIGRRLSNSTPTQTFQMPECFSHKERNVGNDSYDLTVLKDIHSNRERETIRIQ